MNSTNSMKSKNGEDLSNSLNDIFEKILNKDLTKLGIKELYEFKLQYPYAMELIEEKLNQTGAYFQGYIRRGLAHLEEPKENYQMIPMDASVLPCSTTNMDENKDQQNQVNFYYII